MSDVDIKLTKIFTGLLGRNVAVGETVVRANEPNWDSMRHIEIILTTEQAFGIHLDENEIVSVTDSVTLKRLIETKHAA